MAHARTQIRHALAALAAVASVQTVKTGEARATNRSETPAVYVLTPNDSINFEESTLGADGVLQELHQLTASLAVVVQERVGAEDLVDQIEVELRAAMFADPTLGGLVRHLEIASYDGDLLDALEQPLAGGVFTVNAVYRCKQDDPETIIG